MTSSYDFIVIGAGMVGSAIGYGLAGQTIGGRRPRVLMLDGLDTDYRAAKANFGLVWVQGKGLGQPAYQRLSLAATLAWGEFARRLEADSGLPIAYEQNGGLNFCLGDAQMEARARQLDAWHAQTPEFQPSTVMLTRAELMRRYPSMRLGESVSGASLGALDGQVNPLKLMAALQSAFQRKGGELRSSRPVTEVEALPSGGFRIRAGDFAAEAGRVVISAGLGSSPLAAMVGLNVPLSPQRGQLLVTERLAPLLPLPASGLRQTAEGTVMVGVTQENVGYDLSTTSMAGARMARRALDILPDLGRARLVRHWACLRIMTPDGAPVYAASPNCPGVDVATCHSGVTLASLHAGIYAEALLQGSGNQALPTLFHDFHQERFHDRPVQKAA
ncbi:NAD(P)/FAD-dependent oxidoreductase [Simplicispira suum]|uniref:NAD(P)/FAD-dependent oxidoreductase n=1 Tax=Simplicispira suum TaxID=2109915 RepID=UPI001B8062ED|nr:FAD-dependent oxidoreductase [Simplicispira suum]